MFIFGHLGFGLQIARPVQGVRFQTRWILLGTILPDLIDKPVYYFTSWYTGKAGADLGIFSGTRTLGHTGLFLITLTLLAMGTHKRALQALSIGAATHLLLDFSGDALSLSHVSSDPHQNLRLLLWPFLGLQFPIYPFSGVKAHFSLIKEPYFFISEFSGASLLFWKAWRSTSSDGSGVLSKKPKAGR